MILEMIEAIKMSVENPKDYIMNNKERLDEYIKYKQSSEYLNYPVYKIQQILKSFNYTSGYYEVFIPAIKELSPSYAEYYMQLEASNEKLLAEYPEIMNWNN